LIGTAVAENTGAEEPITMTTFIVLAALAFGAVSPAAAQGTKIDEGSK
jgi:hypothetical protein